MGQAADWFVDVSRKGKPVWDEATGLANLIPDSLTSLSPASFVDFFARKRFEANDASRQLESDALPPYLKTYVRRNSVLVVVSSRRLTS